MPNFSLLVLQQETIPGQVRSSWKFLSFIFRFFVHFVQLGPSFKSWFQSLVQSRILKCHFTTTTHPSTQPQPHLTFERVLGLEGGSYLIYPPSPITTHHTKLLTLNKSLPKTLYFTLSLRGKGPKPYFEVLPKVFPSCTLSTQVLFVSWAAIAEKNLLCISFCFNWFRGTFLTWMQTLALTPCPPWHWSVTIPG